MIFITALWQYAQNCGKNRFLDRLDCHCLLWCFHLIWNGCQITPFSRKTKRHVNWGDRSIPENSKLGQSLTYHVRPALHRCSMAVLHEKCLFICDITFDIFRELTQIIRQILKSKYIIANPNAVHGSGDRSKPSTDGKTPPNIEAHSKKSATKVKANAHSKHSLDEIQEQLNTLVELIFKYEIQSTEMP